ncbi:hypothetical protein CBR_g45446 [Chara braunii]|uniref:Uncharacterized protein n=1 Tax=Chara braunii TaxID=69332 RepID=A0A388LYV4_CHABU|nr:hypothetical protein CBR_g45446 [Chara braunii]|eukprot:GBG87389.1 hypothetical protein CBR_g45446 [Chara braunii]
MGGCPLDAATISVFVLCYVCYLRRLQSYFLREMHSDKRGQVHVKAAWHVSCSAVCAAKALFVTSHLSMNECCI